MSSPWNSPSSEPRSPNFSDDGRGAGRQAVKASTGAAQCRSGLEAQVRQLIGHQGGIKVSDAGVLPEDREGQPAGTPYVVITAHSAMDRDIARTLLAGHAGTTELAWEYGWSPRRDASGVRVTDLWLYPATGTAV